MIKEELTEEQIQAIKAIDTQVKADVDSLEKDKNWNTKMISIVKKAKEQKLLILNNKS